MFLFQLSDGPVLPRSSVRHGEEVYKQPVPSLNSISDPGSAFRDKEKFMNTVVSSCPCIYTSFVIDH